MGNWNEATDLLKSIEDINKGFWDVINAVRSYFRDDPPETPGKTSSDVVKESEDKSNKKHRDFEKWQHHKKAKQTWKEEPPKKPITVPFPKKGDAVA